MTITLQKRSYPDKTKTGPIRLDHNENPLGPSPLAIKAAQQALLNCHRYPDSHGSALKISLAAHLGISPDFLTLGNGSEGLLELLGNTYLTTKNSAVLTNYSFIGIKKIIQRTGAQLRIATNTYQYTTAEHILAAVEPTTKIIFIVNPNNPTGTYINALDLNYLLEQLPSHIFTVIDEAYAEYVEASDYPNTIKLLSAYPNLIISRTFSKFYGLAGLRLGYLISHPNIATYLNSLCLAFSVNSIALAAAQASLYDHTHEILSLEANQQARKQLMEGLKKLSLDAIPSHTNFICVNVQKDSSAIYKQLINDGIYVRPLHDYELPNHLRISIGLKNQNQQLLEALYKILSQQP
ncbi:histidinol-phosphate transaminase [Rickettsiella endosymbiont of Dermanyssus gallinae]|uniref:histidinol-phosphate transaminase n=1 Tax=Rickettsiella endosymbiont of Dermanyssus gallinae TaxID=2856608 RepID=UPI001C52ADDB|nr:histidinol-phosphate transaminase [Rickettsiella endosymbiont of Dermanyssus gallinae]